MKVSIHSYDVCLPDYWSGTSLPFVSIPVDASMSGGDINRVLVSEFNGNGFYGWEDGKIDIGDVLRELTSQEKDQLHTLAREALSDFVLVPNLGNPFDLEEGPETDDDETESDYWEPCYLYVTMDIDFE